MENKVTIYGAAECYYCQKAKSLAKFYGLEYVYYDAFVYKEDYKKLFPNSRTVPQILVNGEHIGGYEQFRKIAETLVEGERENG